MITDTISGSKISRKGLDQLMRAVRAGKVDVVLCYNLDRPGRSLSHLVQLLGEFSVHKVALIVPGQGINTSSNNPASTPCFSTCLERSRNLNTQHRRACQRWTSRRTEAGHQIGPSRNSRCSSPGPWPNCARKDAQGAPSRSNSASRPRRSSSYSANSKSVVVRKSPPSHLE